MPRFLSRSRGERGFRKRSFSRRSTFPPNSQRKTLTVDQYHPLRALATLGFTDCGAPFLAGAKLPSYKKLNKPTTSGESNQLEAEPIYETRSSLRPRSAADLA
jgi:hypothetical protein